MGKPIEEFPSRDAMNIMVCRASDVRQLEAEYAALLEENRVLRDEMDAIQSVSAISEERAAQIRTVTLYGGPLDGTKHEIADPFGMGVEPAEMRLPTGPLSTDPRARYVRGEDGEYRFQGAEK